MSSEALILCVFAVTYVGMALGRIPGLRLDRAGIALVGLAVLLVSGAVPSEALGPMVDLPTLILLFALMILSAQFAAAGFYDYCAGRLACAALSPRQLLATVILVSGLLSALLVNDVVVFAITPLLCSGLSARGYDVRPYLLGLAAGSNAGSAATLVGNPQNILIGQLGGLDFWSFLAICSLPALLALLVAYVTISAVWRRQLDTPARPVADLAAATGPAAVSFDRAKLVKGLAGVCLLLILFATPLPRELSALLVAGLMLLSRRLPSGSFFGAVDWPLLLLFASLFVITGAFSTLGFDSIAVSWATQHGLLPDRALTLGPLALVVSNTIGNVPGVVLITTAWPDASAGVLVALALMSTLAGNFLIVGSLANLIVAERASAAGFRLGFRDFARAGIPMTLVSMGLAAVWLWVIGILPL
ncbi:MAG: anion transporter [Alphaproteobacteria bacterium]|nr:MAG: anion transporter [Alphaproteobacteria bacterium]